MFVSLAGSLAFGSAAFAQGGPPMGQTLAVEADTDSYVFFSTDNPFEPYITVGNYTPPQVGHANWGYLSFEGTFTPGATQYLALTSDAYVVATDQQSISTVEDGSAVIEILTMQAPHASYLAAEDQRGWFIGNVVTPEALGTAEFTNDMTVYVDVTAATSGWAAGAPNFGFALRSTAVGNGVEIISLDNGNGPAPTLVASIPEGPVADYFPGVFNNGLDDRYYAGWFGGGWFWAKNFPWIYHEDHGWLFLTGTGGDTVVFWDNFLQSWVWTYPALDNFYYLNSERFGEGWLYHFPGTGASGNGTRWFYDFGGGLWIPLQVSG